jgi:hypothetical protein
MINISSCRDDDDDDASFASSFLNRRSSRARLMNESPEILIIVFSCFSRLSWAGGGAAVRISDYPLDGMHESARRGVRNEREDGYLTASCHSLASHFSWQKASPGMLGVEFLLHVLWGVRTMSESCPVKRRSREEF